MFGRFERTAAFRYLRARRQEGFISIITGFSCLGITLGVATLIIVMSVMNGFRQELLSSVLGFNGHLGVYSSSARGLKDFDPLVNDLRQFPEIKSVTPLVERQAMLSNQNQAMGAVVHGIRHEDLKARTLIADNIVQGSLDVFTQGESIVIGSRLAETFRVFPGDSLTLIAPKGTPTAFGVVPRLRRFTVAAIFNVGMHEYDNKFIFIPLTTAQDFFQTGESISGLEVFLHKPESVSLFRNRLEGLLGSAYRLLDWKDANSTFLGALEVERNVMFLILSLFIIIAMFNIISNLIMLVKDKGQDIAILRTMGASNGMIMRIFFLVGSSIGVIGTLCGVALGLTFSLNIETIRQWLESLTGTELFNAEIYFLSKLPSVVLAGDLTLVMGLALGFSFLATLYPAWRASRLDPVEALRYE